MFNDRRITNTITAGPSQMLRQEARDWLLPRRTDHSAGFYFFFFHYVVAGPGASKTPRGRRQEGSPSGLVLCRPEVSNWTVSLILHIHKPIFLFLCPAATTFHFLQDPMGNVSLSSGRSGGVRLDFGLLLGDIHTVNACRQTLVNWLFLPAIRSMPSQNMESKASYL